MLPAGNSLITAAASPRIRRLWIRSLRREFMSAPVHFAKRAESGARSQPLLHDDPRNALEADASIELDHFGVGVADHELQLGHAALRDPAFGGCDEVLADALPAAVRIGREIIDPAAMPVVADHRCPDDG